MFKNNDWFYISNYLKKSYKNLPSDYIDNLSNQSIYNINYHYDKIILGYDSGLEQVLDNIDFSYLSHDVIKIGLILNKGHLAYSNKSGIFKIYFIDYRDKICDDNLEYVCDTFTDLKLMNENVKKFLNFKQLQNNKPKNTSIEKISNKILSNHDFKIIKNMLKNNVLPQDFIDIFRFQSNFKLKIDDSLTLTFGADSGKEICLAYNSMAIAMPHNTLVIGIDGYGNSILYSNKDGSYKLYIVSDSLFEESAFVYLADNLYELLVHRKSIDTLLNF